jgi:hypothetical protein
MRSVKNVDVAIIKTAQFDLRASPNQHKPLTIVRLTILQGESEIAIL